MTPLTLSVFVDKVGQDQAAKRLGSSQAAISKALKSGRVILVTENSPGCFEGLELKPFPSGGKNIQVRPDVEVIMGLGGDRQQPTEMAVYPSSVRPTA